jgi:hypothetical protein
LFFTEAEEADALSREAFGNERARKNKKAKCRKTKVYLIYNSGRRIDE